jgi:catechol 2,3-dioxygenase-like lactoylglutathione lyase family enzyme
MSSDSVKLRPEGMSLGVSDLDRSVAFYRDMLGFQVEQRHGKAFALLRLGDFSLGLLSEAVLQRRGVPSITRREERRNVEVELTTDDLNAAYAALTARGLVFRGPIETRPWERSAQADDPDGYTIEIAEGARGRNAPQRDR